MMNTPSTWNLAGQDRFEGRILADRYRLVREIGSGGFGVVYLGEDMRVSRQVAIKVLSPRAPNLDRFQREARAAGRVGHAGIVAVTDFDHDADGTPFLVMEYVAGQSLATCISREAPLPPVRALSIAARIAQALAAAHAAGIVHRDLKPANVLLTSVSGVDDIVKIVDFGVSKFLMESWGDSTLTRDGDIVGTPRYMSPEQGMGIRELDGRADVYSLGVILYEMLTGRAPYSGSSAFEVIHLKVTRDPVPPSIACPSAQLPRPIEDLVLRALMADPDRRFQSMTGFDAAIRAALVELAPDAARLVRPSSPPPEPIDDARAQEARTVFLRQSHAVRMTQPLAAAEPPAPSQLPQTLPSPLPAPVPWGEPLRTAIRRPPRRASRVLLAVLAIVVVGGLGALGAAAGLELFGSGSTSGEAAAQPPAARPSVAPPAAPATPETTASESAKPEPEPAVESPALPAAVEPARTAREDRGEARRKRRRRSSEKEPTVSPEPDPERDPRGWGEPIEPY